MMKKSAGCIIIHKFNDEWHILLVHAAGSWKNRKMGIPKGLVEEKEPLNVAAERETFEETGLKVKIINSKPSLILENSYKKVYCFFAYLFHSQLKKIDEKLKVKSIDRDEVDYARFYPLNRAEELIYEYQKPVIKLVRDHIKRMKQITIYEALQHLRHKL